jgi:hypothetical protein
MPEIKSPLKQDFFFIASRYGHKLVATIELKNKETLQGFNVSP